jgi:hypothetical protein
VQGRVHPAVSQRLKKSITITTVEPETCCVFCSGKDTSLLPQVGLLFLQLSLSRSRINTARTIGGKEGRLLLSTRFKLGRAEDRGTACNNKATSHPPKTAISSC